MGSFWDSPAGRMILSKNVWLSDETFRENWSFSGFAARLKPDVENIVFFDTSAF